MIRTTLAVFLAFTATGLTTAAQAAPQKAVVAGGCFWCVESNFESVPGVTGVVSGFTGGSSQSPTYDDHSGHFEAVEISFDDAKISYDQIIAKFLRSTDVVDAGGQFCDRGKAYKSAIFVKDAAQKTAAKAAVAQAESDLGQNIVTPILAAKAFWPAEAYHQDYYKSSDIVLTRRGPKEKRNAYKFYREACGRDARVQQLWGSAAEFVRH